MRILTKAKIKAKIKSNENTCRRAPRDLTKMMRTRHTSERAKTCVCVCEGDNLRNGADIYISQIICFVLFFFATFNLANSNNNTLIQFSNSQWELFLEANLWFDAHVQ